MTPAETKKVYELSCKAKRTTPQDEEGRAWHRVLRAYELRDVQAALEAWWADTTPTSSGRPRGAFMPEPVELKPLAERERKRRELEAATPKDFVAWACLDGCGFSCCGYTETLHTKPCPKCGKVMHERLREKAQRKVVAA